MNKQEYLIITFHSLDDAMDLDAKQTSSMKGRLIPKPSVIDAGCGMCFSCQRYGKVEDFSWRKSNSLWKNSKGCVLNERKALL